MIHQDDTLVTPPHGFMTQLKENETISITPTKEDQFLNRSDTGNLAVVYANRMVINMAAKCTWPLLDFYNGFVDLLGHGYNRWYVVLVDHSIFGERALLLLGCLCYSRCNSHENKIAWVASGLVSMIWRWFLFWTGTWGNGLQEGGKKEHHMYHYYGQKHQNGLSFLYEWLGI